MDAPTRFKPGQECRRSGQYEIVNQDGTLTGMERTVVRGEPFPPPLDRTQTYVLADPTHLSKEPKPMVGDSAKHVQADNTNPQRSAAPPATERPAPDNAYPGARWLNLEKRRALGLTIPITIYIQDPKVAEENPKLGVEEIELDWEPGLMDGPTSARIAVVDYDADQNKLTDPARWDQKQGRFLDPSGRAVGKDTRDTFQFHQVNAWAVVNKVLRFFEESWQGGLGRTIPWAFEGNRLIIVPHAGYGANACYDRYSKSLQLYYCGEEPALDYACLSHDIIAHETGHAILDGIRPYYFEDSSLQTMAFHEFVADLTAILTALRNNDLRQVLAKVSKGDLDQAGFLPNLGEVFGKYTENREYVRTALNDVKMKKVQEERGAHYCSQVLTGAMFDIMADIARQYIQKRKKTAKQALWYAIENIRRIALRPLDYLPPVDVQFVDYARAVLQAHELSDPQDEHGYRPIMREVFQRRGLSDLQEKDEPSKLIFRYPYDTDRISRSRTDAYHFLNENRRQLCIPEQQDFVVADLYDTDPTDPEGRKLPREIVLQYVWREGVELKGSRWGELENRSVPLLCGGTLVLDDRGNVLFWVRKPGTEEIKCTDGSPHPRCTRDQETGQERRDHLLEHVAYQTSRGLVSLADASSADRLDMTMTPVVGRQAGGALRLERTPHLRHWGEE